MAIAVVAVYFLREVECEGLHRTDAAVVVDKQSAEILCHLLVYNGCVDLHVAVVGFCLWGESEECQNE